MPESLPVFNGLEFFPAPPERVFALLIDLEALARGLPGVQTWDRPAADTLTAIVRPGVSILRGKLDVDIVLRDVQSSHSLVMLTSARGIGLELQVQTAARLSSAGENTRLDWTSQIIKLSGLTARMSRPILLPLIEQMIRQGWQRAREQLTVATYPSINK